MHFKFLLAFAVLAVMLITDIFASPDKLAVYPSIASIEMLDVASMPVLKLQMVAAEAKGYFEVEPGDGFSLALLVIDFGAIAHTDLRKPFGWEDDLYDKKIAIVIDDDSYDARTIIAQAERYGLRPRSVTEVIGFSPIMLC